MARKDPEAERKYQREYQRKVRSANPGLAAMRTSLWRAKNPESSRAHSRRQQGLPTPTRPMPEWCECCDRVLEKTPHLDHCHRAGKFRGWLCGPCNHALGLLGDTLEGAEKAVAYLKRTS